MRNLRFYPRKNTFKGDFRPQNPTAPNVSEEGAGPLIPQGVKKTPCKGHLEWKL